jgi:hypothetical protein
MAIDATPFYHLHGTKVFFFPGIVGKPCIAPGHLNGAVTQELLQALQAHAGIEQFAGKGMSQTVKRISLVGKTGFAQALVKGGSGSLIGQGSTLGAVKNIRPF